jgi:hypothetical protein
MTPDNKGMLAKQIAFGYGIAISILIGISGTLVIWAATDMILRNYQDLIEVRERSTNETVMLDYRNNPGALKEEVRIYENSFNVSYQRGMTFILVGLGVLLLADAIAYVPMSLYAENGKEILKDHNPKKRRGEVSE